MPESARPFARDAAAVLHFWFTECKPWQWYRRDAALDADIKLRFSGLHAAAAAGALDVWRAHPRHSLALVIILDQFSRNLYREDARAFAQDAAARTAAIDAIRRRFDMIAAPKQRAFFYMPFMHSETLADQNRSVALFKARLPASNNIRHAVQHRDIIARFGRFPHRNAVLGRSTTDEEAAYLKSGGFRA